MKNKIDYSLYVVTDRNAMSSPTIEESVARSIMGGATVIQLREKNISYEKFLELGMRVKAITSRFNVPLIVNDNIDIALAINAEGVHVGQSDKSCTIARRALGKYKIVGVSATNLREAMQAVNDGADYLGVGAMFPTNTKTDATMVSMEELKRIRANVSVPIVAIGGIKKQTIPAFKGTGIDGIAVISAVIAEQDPTAAAREIKKLFKSTMTGSGRVLQ